MGGIILMRRTSQQNTHLRFPWILILCFGLWAGTGLFFLQDAYAKKSNGRLL
jgi:hypothetical protein